MKRFKEITLENLGELKSIINTVKREANEKKDYAGKCVMLIGEETIRKAIDRYHINGSEYQWERADEAVQHLKINGSAKFVYTAQVLVYWDARWINRGTAEIEYITKNISYNGYLLSAYKDSYSDKTYNFHLFNEASDNKQGMTLDKPNKVGTLTDEKADAWLSVLLDETEKRQEAQKAAGKNNYYLEITANGKPVSNDVLPKSFRYFYEVTDEEIKFVTIGLAIGLRARYKKPKIEVYKEKTDGEYKYCYTQNA